MKPLIIATVLLSVMSLAAPSFAAEDSLPAANEEAISTNDIAKQLAGMLYLLEKFGKKIEKEFKNFSNELEKELEEKRKKNGS